MVKVSEIMKKKVKTIEPAKTVYEAARIMTNNRVGSLVVLRAGKPVDMITESDVTTIVSRGLDPKKVKISELRKNRIKRPSGLVTAKPSDNILDVTKLMVKNGVKRVPVVQGGKLKGIIADKEILTISPELIEILSEKIKTRISAVPDGSGTISGMCEECGCYSDRLRQVNEIWVCEECASNS